MTDPTTDPYAGASQPAAEVRDRAFGSEITNQQRAKSDGFYTDPEGVRRQIIAGDPIPAGVEIDAGSEAKAADQAPEDKSKRAAERK